MKATTSIQHRLIVYLSSALISLWITITIGSGIATFHEINEIADSQMLQLAYTIKQVSPNLNPNAMEEAEDIKRVLRHHDGYADIGDHGFAIWMRQNQDLLLADKKGKHFTFSTHEGFRNDEHSWLKGWRYVYLVDDKHVVAVGQQVKERMEMLFNALWVQLTLILLSVPILLILIIYGVRKGLFPLKQIIQELHSRNANSLHEVSEQVPSEIQPLMHELNRLFARLNTSIQKERRFTSDAAHELRSPLAALKIQTEVLAMSEDKDEQLHHLHNIQTSIERANRLIEQLLILSRLDPMQGIPDAQVIDWTAVVPQVLQGVNLAAREKRIKLKLDCHEGLEKALPLSGNAVLIQTMLRNLLDNAIRYSPENTTVTLTMMADGIIVQDQGPGIAPEEMDRIKERFYRPAGQKQQGSGLGFSIIENIAQLHGLTLQLQNHHGLRVSLKKYA